MFLREINSGTYVVSVPPSQGLEFERFWAAFTASCLEAQQIPSVIEAKETTACPLHDFDTRSRYPSCTGPQATDHDNFLHDPQVSLPYSDPTLLKGVRPSAFCECHLYTSEAAIQTPYSHVDPGHYLDPFPPPIPTPPPVRTPPHRGRPANGAPCPDRNMRHEGESSFCSYLNSDVVRGSTSYSEDANDLISHLEYGSPEPACQHPTPLPPNAPKLQVAVDHPRNETRGQDGMVGLCTACELVFRRE